MGRGALVDVVRQRIYIQIDASEDEFVIVDIGAVFCVWEIDVLSNLVSKHRSLGDVG